MSLIILEQQMDNNPGTYETRDLLQDIDTNFASVITIADNTYTTTFQNADLTAGVLTIAHNLNTGYPKPTMRRPDGTFETALAIMEYVDVNTVRFDFGGAIDAGVWLLLIDKTA